MGILHKLSNEDDNSEESENLLKIKPFYKRPVFWITILIILFPILFLISCFCGGGSEEDTDIPIPLTWLSIKDDQSQSDVKYLDGIKDEYKDQDFSKYNSIQIPNDVKYISANAFDNTHVSLSFINSIEIIDYVNNSILDEIKDNAFSGLTNLEYVKIPSSLTTFGDSVFKDDLHLTIFQIDTPSLLTYSTDLLTNTPISSSSIDEPNGMIIILTNDLVKQYLKADGWKNFDKDVFTSQEDNN